MTHFFEIDGNPIGLILTGGPLQMTLEGSDVSSGDDEQPSIGIVDFGEVITTEAADEPIEETSEGAPAEDFAPDEAPFAGGADVVDALVEALDTPADEIPAATAAVEVSAFETVDTEVFVRVSAQGFAAAQELVELPFSDRGSEMLDGTAATFLL